MSRKARKTRWCSLFACSLACVHMHTAVSTTTDLFFSSGSECVLDRVGPSVLSPFSFACRPRCPCCVHSSPFACSALPSRHGMPARHGATKLEASMSERMRCRRRHRRRRWVQAETSRSCSAGRGSGGRGEVARGPKERRARARARASGPRPTHLSMQQCREGAACTEDRLGTHMSGIAIGCRQWAAWK